MIKEKIFQALSKRSWIVDLIIFIFVFLFLLSYFEPRYILSLTTSTGGDMVSHYPTAVYMKEVFLPAGKVMGWDPGNYAGYPLFYHYFPLTFILMALLSFLIPMQVAFKLISILGTFILPVCVYFAFRLLKFRFPIPIMGAVFSLAFLFMEANSMWGGNIPSTLAGEYSYGFSLAIMVLFFGSLYDGIINNRRIIFNAFLVFLIGFSHGFTLVFSGVIAFFFLLTKKDFGKNFFYLFRVFGLAGLLLSFWLIPFLMNFPFVTSYVTRWHIESIFKVIPPVLMPFFVLSFVAFFLNLFDRRTFYFGYVICASVVMYFLSTKIGMLDIRFIPFLQIFMTIFGATFIFVFMDKVKKNKLLPFIVYLLVILWVFPNITFIKGWIKWNYEGFEEKASWSLFQDINQHLSRGGKGRVVYEHSAAHNCFGSERAFENLSYFANRDTLEGLYMQSSISSPFVFYIQSEVSKVCSGPFPQYKYTHLNLPAAIPHLKLFNVTHYIARSPEAKKQAKTVSALRLEKTLEDYELYRVTSHNGKYVVPVSFAPVLFETDSWKQDFHLWFRRLELLDIPLVYIYKPTQDDLDKIRLRADDLFMLPKVPLNVEHASITERLGKEEIEFTTNMIGHPHLIKVSYHSNWQVEGADKIYLVSPSFMLVYPNQSNVRLYFGKTVYNYIGEILSLLGLSIILISGIISFRHVWKT